jgi:hypothetical protein
MKKILLLFLGLSFAGCLEGLAQTEKKNLIKANLLSPIVRTGSFFYERVVAEKSSIQLGFYYTGFQIAGTRFRGFGITPEYRHYLSASQQAPTGFYIGPFLRYQNLDVSVENSSTGTASLSSFGGGLVLGGQWVFSDIVSLDVYGGPNYNARNITYAGGAVEDDFNFTGFGNFGLRLGVTLGLAF